ncbi:MAG: chromosome segregation protein SMC [Gemmatimonadota bacterium]|nr:chromosome segregation protein SMC [Gemmatimonadota bacterium]
MKLRALKVHGFKSFADSTTVEFHDGITAVVGPNGCGKSNIGDAIRWVLGEQRASAIRGTRMEEAIFQGTVGRRPVNRGSVSLIVSNDDGSLPVPFEEVEVGRQVFRDGGSEYSINRSACRLKDVVELCRDTGLGANAYSVIENKMIDAILSDRAEERRGLFEEASGIGKYKDRRKAANRRLERAEMDLQRLEDVISEVETKVRSLARQKGKAQRYMELRQRRLDVEATVVRREMSSLTDRLSQVDQELQGDSWTAEGMRAELRKAEAEVESLRLKEVEAQKARTEAADVLERTREKLVEWERDLAVANEREAYAERRLARIDEERREALERAEAMEREAEELEEERAKCETELQEARRSADAKAGEAEGVRNELAEARSRVETAQERTREIARRTAQLQGDAEAADAQAEELERRLEKTREELETATEQLSDLASQGDLFSGRLDELARDVEEAHREFERQRSEVDEAREALEKAREGEREAVDRAAEIGARVEALERLERDQEGVEPVVRAALDLGDDGVWGTLADFIAGPPETVAAAEAYLGSVARALVVEDDATVHRLVDWFAASWTEGGGLTLLPLDRVPVEEPGGGVLLDGLTVEEPAAAWVRALLTGVELEGSTAGGVPVTSYRGVVRMGNPTGASGILERKERLRLLRAEHNEALDVASGASATRMSSQETLSKAEEELERLRTAWRKAEDGHRKAEAELEAQSDQHGRMDRRRDDLSRQLEGTRATRERAIERAREARAERETLIEQESGVEEEREAAGKALEAVQERWEAVRAEEARLAVDVARLEGDLRRLTEKLQSSTRVREEAGERAGSLDEEEGALRREREDLRTRRAEGEAAIERLFEERTAAEEALRKREEALQGVSDALAAAERHAREARTAERESSDRRHELELERQELTGRVERIRERLEGEWGRALESLMEEANEVAGDTEALQEELTEIVEALERIGPVNMLAVEEHAEETERLDFLQGQRDDLIEARNDLRSAIREINRTATDLFTGTFEEIRQHFRDTFVRLFEGGDADIKLEDPDDPLESPVEIHASPRGKRTQRIDLLSGGERALTALSLLFGIYLVKPSPFCVLDEVDAPLDENNIGRFIRLLQDFKEQTQFVVITHNPRTIEAADWIYGVTMEEPGVSTIVGVKLEEALEAAGIA